MGFRRKTGFFKKGLEAGKFNSHLSPAGADEGPPNGSGIARKGC
jgi:hypothetical protein